MASTASSTGDRGSSAGPPSSSSPSHPTTRSSHADLAVDDVMCDHPDWPPEPAVGRPRGGQGRGAGAIRDLPPAHAEAPCARTWSWASCWHDLPDPGLRPDRRLTGGGPRARRMCLLPSSSSIGGGGSSAGHRRTPSSRDRLRSSSTRFERRVRDKRMKGREDARSEADVASPSRAPWVTLALGLLAGFVGDLLLPGLLDGAQKLGQEQGRSGTPSPKLFLHPTARPATTPSRRARAACLRSATRSRNAAVVVIGSHPDSMALAIPRLRPGRKADPQWRDVLPSSSSRRSSCPSSLSVLPIWILAGTSNCSTRGIFWISSYTRSTAAAVWIALRSFFAEETERAGSRPPRSTARA